MSYLDGLLVDALELAVGAPGPVVKVGKSAGTGSVS